jgi:hypothetical protein
MANLRKVLLSDICTKGTQWRRRMDTDTVTAFAQAMTAGDVFPPIALFERHGVLWCGDGHHRIEGARRAGLTEIAAEVRDGGKRDAIVHGLTENRRHGLRPSRADRRHAVLLMLRDEEPADVPQIADRTTRRLQRGFGRARVAGTRSGRRPPPSPERRNVLHKSVGL